MDSEIIYLGTDNTVDLILKADDVAVSLASVTKMELTVGAVLISSTNLATDTIRWNQAGYDTGEVRLQIGKVTGLAIGQYDAPLVVYDATNDDGIVWITVPLTVTDATPAAPAAGTGPGLVLAPQSEPITLTEAKLNLRVDGDDEDDLIRALIVAAREHIEDITRRALLTQTWDFCLDSWPDRDFIRLPFGNLQSVTSIKWKDTDGTETTLTLTTDYLVETNGEQCGRIVLPYGGSWPTGTLYPSNPITIRFVCGWTTATLIPGKIKVAVKLWAENLYLHAGRSEALEAIVVTLARNSRIWEECP